MPFSPLERPLTLSNLGEDLIVATVEGRISTKQNVEHDSNAPHVALLIVFTSENLWGNVVGSTVKLSHTFRLVEVVRGAEVYHLDLVIA